MKTVYVKPFLVAAIIVLVDQVVKTWVRTHMDFHSTIPILGKYGELQYTLNNGMAFGWELGGKVGKLILTLFRIVAVCGIGYGLVYLIKHKYHRGLIMCVALIFAGALGNIIDSTFYGILFQNGHLFEGQVVDMFHFPLFHGTYPSWFPIWRGQEFTFFDPIFNLADASISVGVIAILIFQKRYFKREVPELASPNSEMEEV